VLWFRCDDEEDDEEEDEEMEVDMLSVRKIGGISSTLVNVIVLAQPLLL
jgi:hypothetical protein